MRGDIKGDHLIIYVRNIKTIGLIFIFMVLTILYYFLRFQFDQPALVAIAQVSLLSLLALLALWGMVSGKFRFIHISDYMLLHLVNARDSILRICASPEWLSTGLPGP